MNVKKYRATTTREALEMIKQDLGADAFVLDTKQVRTGGFLGFRSNMQIEVSAAAPGMAADTFPKERAMKGIPSNRILNLTDDTPAAPLAAVKFKSDRKETMLSALSARAESSNEFETLVTKNVKIEPVEISTEAPRVVHARKEIVKAAAVETVKEEKTEIALQPTTSSREFDLLRAELREVKFSLGAFANRQNAATWQTDLDMDLFGEVFEAPYYQVYSELIDTGISPETARQFVADIIPFCKNTPIDEEKLTRTTLLRAMSSMMRFTPDPLKDNAVMAVIGATGVGKTTTVAKLAAVEQLKTYAEIIGAGCHVVRSVLELDATLRRLPSDATVLIDTTGRSPHDLADQYELSEYLRHRDDIRKCLAVQATVHPIDAAAAIKKFEMYGADCLALTKMDETMRPGAAIELIAGSNLPLAFLCNGQRVPEDLQTATAEAFTNRILGVRS